MTIQSSRKGMPTMAALRKTILNICLLPSLLLLAVFLFIAVFSEQHSYLQQPSGSIPSATHRNLRRFLVGDATDLNFRFNKISFPNTQQVPDFMPLTADDYPIRGDMAIVLKEQSNAISIICDDDPALGSNHQARLQQYINAIGGGPTMPSSNENDAFWDDFRQVVQMQIGRRQGVDPNTILRPPDLWADRDIHQVAEAVHDEYPGYHQEELIKWLWSQGVQLDYDIIPYRSAFDFVGTQVAMADLNTWAIGVVAPMNFYAKWHYGRPRPEEVAFLIARMGLTNEDHGVPLDIVSDIKAMTLRHASDFTAYPEGSPRHPAWPAMHSAASSASFWLAVVMDLSPEQYCEALRVDYTVAFARSCAGVHYPTDNTAGLNLGQEIIVDALPTHLHEKYGSNMDKVREKIERLRFNWENFDSYTCSTA